jgi:hypothetical protein
VSIDQSFKTSNAPMIRDMLTLIHESQEADSIFPLLLHK